MAPTRRFATIVALAAFAVSACSNNDAKQSDVVDAMTDAGLTAEQADCVGEQFDEAFSQDELNDLAGATSEADIPDADREEVDAILQDCVGSGSAGDTDDTSDTTADDAGSDESDASDASDSTATTAG
jgi:hypothetical protein